MSLLITSFHIQTFRIAHYTTSHGLCDFECAFLKVITISFFYSCDKIIIRNYFAFAKKKKKVTLPLTTTVNREEFVTVETSSLSISCIYIILKNCLISKMYVFLYFLIRQLERRGKFLLLTLD